MQHSITTLTGAEKILVCLALFRYLTASQLTRLLYAPASESYVRKQLRRFQATKLVVPLISTSVLMPHVYTLTEKGHARLAVLGLAEPKRVRSSEEQDKARNRLFLQHTVAVSDVLIAAYMLSQTHPEIVLTRLYTERELKRKISVTLANPGETGREICIEPDASVQFTIAGKWEDFFHIEVYRNLPPADWRFKQKIAGYVTTAITGQHEALFATSALSIAIFCQTDQMAQTLKKWTEETLTEINHPEQSERFFFRSGAVALASPEEMYLSPVWEQAFSTTTTPLLVLEW